MDGQSNSDIQSKSNNEVITKPKILKNLTGFRTIAALLVAFSHYGVPAIAGSTLTTIAFKGYSGVTAFFILSGFVLCWSQLSKSNIRVTSYSSFIIERFSRIFPLHLFVLLLSIVLLWISDFDISTFIAHITLTQAWLPDISKTYAYNSVAWALSVEIFLYICFPIIYRISIFLYTRYNKIGIFTIISFGLLIPIFALSLTSVYGLNEIKETDYLSAHYFLYRFPITRLGDFTIGIGIALLVFYAKPISKYTAITIQFLCILLYIFFSQVDFSFQSFLGAASFDVMWIPIFASSIYSLSISTTGKLNNILSTKLFVSLGTWSFAFYLLHYQLYTFLQKHEIIDANNKDSIWSLSIVALLTTTTIFSWLLYKHIEQPTQKLIKKIFLTKG